jgi:hypothetical protein
LSKWNVNPDIVPVSLLLLFGFAVSVTFILIALVHGLARRNAIERGGALGFSGEETLDGIITYRPRPLLWLAIKSRNLEAVRAAFGLEHGHPCSLPDGLEGNQRLFIAAPINGWILVTGSGLPDPSDDPDVCFKLLSNLSRALGQVQFFSACRITFHHAWVRAESGSISRAYAWAGSTIWQQGNKSSAEKNLRMACFDYAEPGKVLSSEEKNLAMLNVDKVPLLASRWSLDPAAIDEQLYQHSYGIAA